MSLISFVPKARFQLFDRPQTIVSVKRTDERTELEVIDEDGVVHVHSQDYLFDQYLKRNLRAADFIKESVERLQMTRNPVLKLANDLAKKDREEGERNASLLNAVNEEGGFHRGNTSFWSRRYLELCGELGFKSAPDRVTIRRWLRKTYGSEGIPLQITLAPRNDLKGGRGKVRISDTVERIVETCVQDIYFSSENTPLTECYEELVKRIHQENQFRDKRNKLRCPSYGQLRRYVKGVDAYDIHAARFGRESADKKFRVSREDSRRYRRALERVEVDHTPLDIFVVDHNREVLGRAYLTLVVDRRTRAILGFNLGFEGPSTISVLRALKHSVSPKTYLRERFPEVEHDWPMFGLIDLLAMDNGPEFHADPFRATVLDMGIAREFAYMPRAKPFYKGLVEQLQGYLNRGIASGQPGATMSHHWQRNEERPPEEYAVHTLESINKMMHIWICDVYHQTVQKKLGTSPHKAWLELTAQMPVRLPASKEHLDLACTIPTTRKLQGYGVEVCYLRSFNNKELERLIRRHTHSRAITVDVRYKPYRLDKVWVKDPDTKSWFPVENRDPETCDTTEWQQEQTQRVIRDAKNEQGEVISRAVARAKLRATGVELLSATTMAKRRRALKILGLLPVVDLINEPAVTPATRPKFKLETCAPKTTARATKKHLTVPLPRPDPEFVVNANTPAPVTGGHLAVMTLPVI